MDIVLTIPKSRYEKNAKMLGELLNDGGCIFWVMSRVPKGLEIGDRVHFVKHGRVEHSLQLFRIREYATEKCISTETVWSGRCILYMNDLQYCQEIIAVRGFQGFRYKWWQEAEVI